MMEDCNSRFLQTTDMLTFVPNVASHVHMKCLLADVYIRGRVITANKAAKPLTAVQVTAVDIYQDM